MKRLLILITCIFCSPLAHAASARSVSLPKTPAEKLAYYSSVLHVSANASDKEIEKAYRKLAIVRHPDKNKSNPQAQAAFQEISDAREFLLKNLPQKPLSDAERIRLEEQEKERYGQSLQKGRDLCPFLERCDRLQELAKRLSDAHTSSIEDLKVRVEENRQVDDADEQELEKTEKALEPLRVKAFNAFINACEEVRNSPWFADSNMYGWEIDDLMDEVRAAGHILQTHEDTLNRMKLALAKTFINACQQMFNDPICPAENKEQLEALIKSVQNSQPSPELQKQYAAIKTAIDQLQKKQLDVFKKQLDVFIDSCEAVRNSPWFADSNMYGWQIDHLIFLARTAGHVLPEYADSLNSMKRALAKTFIHSCQQMLNDPICPAENKEQLEALIKSVGNSQLSPEHQKQYDAINAVLAPLLKKQLDEFIDACEQVRTSPWFSSSNISAWQVNNLINEVRAAGHLSPEDADTLNGMKLALAKTFINACQQMFNDPICPAENKEQLEALIKSVESSQLSSEHQKQYDAIKTTIDQLQKKQIDEFINSCEEVKNHRLYVSYRHWRVNIIINNVRRNGHVRQEDREGLAQEQRYIDFMARKNAAQHCAWCSSDHRARLQDLQMRVQDPITENDFAELRAIEGELAQGKINYDAVNNFVAQCNAFKRDHNLSPNAYEMRFRIDALIEKVQRQRNVSDADRNALRHQETLDFRSSCWQERQPCGNSTEHYDALQRLALQVEAKGHVDDADQIALKKIKNDKYKTFLAQCQKLERENVENEDFSHYADFVRLQQDLHNDANHQVSNDHQRRFFQLDTDVKKATVWRQHKDKGLFFFKMAAPFTLALLHGLINNALAHRAGGDLKQVAFYAAPWREWLTGCITLCAHGLLGGHLKQQFGHFYPHGNSKLFLLAYIMGTGIMQNVGERLPLAGTGWRPPINPNGSRLANIFLSNSSLFMGSAGGVALALSKAVGY